MAKYYTWTEIRKDDEIIEPGTVVTPTKLGDSFDSLLEARAIRTNPYPKMGSFVGSVRSFRQDQLRKLRDGLDDDLYDLEEEEEGEQVV